eukprot:TRINITY_DN17344_c0_g1_i1.p1 TRINITY_DN17344_c0_g1~~TRINITY_DN17344_c0_g1_i1.p1  ORF type:complete len:389 (+),score=110.57 TRINITY_DN17344_c0_g1_i1:152-1318(+)
MILSKLRSATTILRPSAARGFASATVKLAGYETFKLDEKSLPPTQASINTEEALKYYKDMLIVRRMEIACDNLYKNKEIRGFCHLCDGQEAIAIGMEAALTWEDCIITAYRDHGQAYGRGDTPFQIISELMGKKTGSTGGKGGSMHFYRKKNNFYGGNGIVGAQCAVGPGLAFGIKYLGRKNISVTMYGDGAANQGQLYEAANMAKLWNLPCVFVCENNRYGMGTSTKRAAANDKFYTRLDPIPGLRIDGQNILTVREVFKWAKDFCNADKGPLCIEIDTYRYHGHSMSDPGISYRQREEVQDIRQTRDPILTLRNIIVDNKLSDEETLKKIDTEVKELIEKAVEDAKKAEFPDQTELLKDVYIEPQEDYFIRGVEWDQSRFPGKKAY